MSISLTEQLTTLGSRENQGLLCGIQRGLEKESLRISPDGKLAQTPHPDALGSALSHDYITTDYSEALLEFITPVSVDIDDALTQLEEIHRFTYAGLGDELLWGASMPCVLAGDANIPVADYGNSNVGRMKKVYRYGLGHRYGRLMQTIAGIHFNFSMPAGYWQMAQALDGDTRPEQDYITDRYLGLIRNFQRHSWLLIYLFGASPAVCKSFVRDNPNHGLEPFDEESRSLHLPYATSLRMGDLGYQSNAQKELNVCYNQLSSYISTLHKAITQPHADYEAIGVGDNHERQLNTSLLQIENEFYSQIRPKRVTRSGEIPLGALKERGIEYIEVRCVDVNPFLPLGIDAEQIRVMDSFLLYCLMEQSPPCDEAEQRRMADNHAAVVNRGRDPNLQLQRGSQSQSLEQYGTELLDQMTAVAELLDQHQGGNLYQQALHNQRDKLSYPELTPSARVLREMKEQQVPFFRLAMNYSEQWANQFRQQPLTEARARHFNDASSASLQRQLDMESADSASFENYLANYYQQYDALEH